MKKNYGDKWNNKTALRLSEHAGFTSEERKGGIWGRFTSFVQHDI